MIRPLATRRSVQRVQPGTALLYLAAVLPYVAFVNASTLNPSQYELAFFAGEFSQDLRDGDVRVFHSSFVHFFPMIDRSRITAELKGVERCTVKTPTTPFTYKMMISLAYYARQTLGLPQAVGIIVGFSTLLRSVEIIKIRVLDIIFRGGHVAKTTIRLGLTKNNRECLVQLEPNSLAERALRYLLGQNPDKYVPLFGFSSYRDLYKCILNFKLNFRLRLHLTPHSLRAGGATHLKLRGFTVQVIADIGRWEDLRTAKSYIDVIFNILPETLVLEGRCWPTVETALNFLAQPF